MTAVGRIPTPVPLPDGETIRIASTMARTGCVWRPPVELDT